MRPLLATACVALLSAAAPSAQEPAGWLDRPLGNWNSAGVQVPAAPDATETPADLAGRCGYDPPDPSAAGAVLAAAGWIPFLHLDRVLARDGVEVLGGLTGADGMCRPLGFNLFVFVDGRFAGTLAPGPMASRSDGSAGAVRLAGPDALTAEFARYLDTDALCCPSARVTVRYRIDRTSSGPVIVAVGVRQTRG